MKTKKLFFYGFSSLFILIISSCFSPWMGGEGTISVNVGGGNTMMAINQTEIAGLEHEIILNGPNGIITKTIKGSGIVTFQALPGMWTVTIRSTGNMPSGYNDLVTWGTITLAQGEGGFPDRTLRAHGISDPVEVIAGTNAEARVEMFPAAEISTWQQLVRAIARARTAEAGEEKIVLVGNLTLGNTMAIGDGTVTRHITLVAERDITITRDSWPGGVSDPVFNVQGGSKLFLGESGMAGTLTIDGGGSGITHSSSLIGLSGLGSTLEMYDGVTLTNNVKSSGNGGAVNVTAPARNST